MFSFVPIAVLASLQLVQAPGDSLEAGEAHLVEEVHALLAMSRPLRDAHRGYMALMHSDPLLENVEDDYIEASTLSEFRRLTGAFEDSILADRDVGGQFRDYNVLVSGDNALRALDAQLQGLARVGDSQVRDLSGGLESLLANPFDALELLGEPANVEAEQGPLASILRGLEVNPTRLGEHLSAFEGLSGSAGIARLLLPWWLSLGKGRTPAAAYHGVLMRYLNDYPHLHRVWRERNLQWAAQAGRIEWVQYLHGLVRRDPALEPIYFRYLSLLSRKPEIRGKEKRAWERTYGPTTPWPPPGRPPSLPRLAADPPEPASIKPQAPTVSVPKIPRVERPQVPTVRRPAAPEISPIRPIVPRRPDATERP